MFLGYILKIVNPIKVFNLRLQLQISLLDVFLKIKLEIECLYLELFNCVKFFAQTNMLHVHYSS